MRNGNFVALKCLLAFSLFLSYLWGMETSWLGDDKVPYIACSYPTYEEWKPFFKTIIFYFGVPSSYPTYEEWKQYMCQGLCPGSQCSYPTYEEWKHKSMFKLLKCVSVLILPMRNGNKTSFIFLLFIVLFLVLILPMRNGNLAWPIMSKFFMSFLSYLWGIKNKETRV